MEADRTEVGRHGAVASLVRASQMAIAHRNIAISHDWDRNGRQQLNACMKKMPYLIAYPPLFLDALINKDSRFCLIDVTLRRDHRCRLDGGTFDALHDGKSSSVTDTLASKESYKEKW